ncbi:MAG: hypothetical protein ACTSSJ_04060 [Candidatus Odinarchaeia archaeon]
MKKSKIKLITVSLLFTLILTLPMLTKVNAQTNSWNIVVINDLSPENIKSNGITLVNNPLVIDANGYPHIIYNKDWQIIHVFNNSGYFNETFYSGVIGSMPSLDLDENGRIHLSYYVQSESGVSDIYYYKEGDSGPVKVTDGGGIYSIPSIAVDPNGYVHIAYISTVNVDGNTRLRVIYVNNVGGSFTSPMEINYTGYRNIAYPSVKIDSLGNAHIICYGQTDEGVYILYCNYSSGVLSNPIKVNSTLISASTSIPIPDITVDENNVIHIVMTAADLDDYTAGNPDFNYTAVYYLNISNGVPSQPVKVSGNIEKVSHPSIAVYNHTVHIVFAGRNNSWSTLDYDIFYVNNASGSFAEPTKIVENEHTDYFPSIAVDKYGYVHIVFYETLSDGTLAKIYYVTNSPNSPLPVSREIFPWIWVGAGVGGAAAIVIIILGWRKYKEAEIKLEKEIRKKNK